MSRRSSAPLPILIAVVLAGCAGGQAPARTASAAPQAPDGEEILQRVCTACHDLGGLHAYADYWGEAEWREMIDIMVGYGARLTPEEFDVLARYLSVAYGTAGKEPGGG